MVSIVSVLFLVFVSLISVDGKLSFSNCGTTNDAIRLNTFDIKPHPAKLPASGKPPNVANFHLGVRLSQNIVSPIKTDFKLWKKVLGINIAVPCTNGVGSCTYADWCEFCSCCDGDLSAGDMAMVLPMSLTADTPSGTYVAQINFTSKTGQKGCVKLEGIEMKNKFSSFFNHQTN